MSFDLRIDVDPVIICPYNKSHRIARSRIQKHLVKCEKNFPDDYKQQCPYDATHRIFEHEMIEHVTNCNRKFKSTFLNDDCDTNLPEADPENKINIDENWDENYASANKSNPFNEPIFETIKMKRPTYTNIPINRCNSLISVPNHSNMRRTFGYSEAMMLDMSHTTDEDAQSITSEMGIGRGQSLQFNQRQYVKGSNRIYRRCLRGK